MRHIKISEYAKAHNLSYQTAWNHFKAGKIGNTKQLESGTILVGVSDSVLEFMAVEELNAKPRKS